MASTVVYATKEELKSQPGSIGTGYDTVLDILLEAASRAIDGYCNRQEDGFVASSTPSPRLFTGNGQAYQWIDECVEITLVEVKSGSRDSQWIEWESNDWVAFCGSHMFPNFNKTPYTGIMSTNNARFPIFTSGSVEDYWDQLPTQLTQRKLPTVRVTAKWGYATTTPPLVKQATITQASKWFKRGQGFWADMLSSPDQGVMFFRKAIDPDIQMMLRYGRMIKASVP